MIHRLLQRQLKKLGLDPSTPPSADAWRQVVDLINQMYIQADRDRYLLERSLDLTSREMQELYDNLRRTSETRVAAERDKLQAVMDHVIDGIITFDQQGLIDSLNRAAERIFGYQADQVIGRHIDMLVVFSERPWSMLSLEKQGRILAGEENGVDVFGLRQDGTRFPIDLALSQMALGGRPMFIAIARDITDRLQTEQTIRWVQKLESLGILAGGIAHDFNNLLVAMMGQASLALAKLTPDHPAQDHIERTIEATQRAADLTRQMLAYSGQGQFQVGALDLNKLLQQNLQFFSAVIAKHIELVQHLADPLPMVEGDATQLQQVIMNLVLNGTEAIGQEPGTITVHTQTRVLTDEEESVVGPTGTALAPGLYVVLEVADDGRGMDADTLLRIFDPFFSTKGTGRGLGLAAVLGIVRGHRGGIQVESQPGLGTRFRLYLPASVGTAAKDLPAPSVPIETSGHEGLVLVIDDEALVREAVTDILAMEGIQVLAASDGQAGIELYLEQREAIRLVLLDLSMPGMSGEEVFAQLRQIDPSVRVILSSGYHEAEVSRRFAAIRPAGFIQKPYSIAALNQLVRRQLGT